MDVWKQFFVLQQNLEVSLIHLWVPDQNLNMFLLTGAREGRKPLVVKCL